MEVTRASSRCPGWVRKHRAHRRWHRSSARIDGIVQGVCSRRHRRGAGLPRPLRHLAGPAHAAWRCQGHVPSTGCRRCASLLPVRPPPSSALLCPPPSSALRPPPPSALCSTHPAASCVLRPKAPASSTYAVIIGHLVGGVVAVAVNQFLAKGDPMAPGVAVALAIFGMKLLDCVHPPAAACASPLTDAALSLSLRLP